MRINKFLLGIVLFLSGVTVFAQQTPASATSPKAPEPFLWSFDDGSYLGIYPEDITHENMSQFKLNEPRGVAVEKVVENSPAAKAGLQNGDVILRFNGEEVTSVRKLNRLISEVAPDHKVKLTISRGGDEKDVTVTLGKRTELNGKMFEPLLRSSQNIKIEGLDKLKGMDKLGNLAQVYSFGSSRRIGVSTMQMNKQLADYFGVADGKGVLITEVRENSPAAKAGLKAGDVIIAVDGENIERTGDLSRAFMKKKEGDVTLTIIRNRSQQQIRVTPEEVKGMIEMPDWDDGFGRVVMPRVAITPPQVRVTTLPQVKVTMPSVNIVPNIVYPRLLKSKRIL